MTPRLLCGMVGRAVLGGFAAFLLLSGYTAQAVEPIYVGTEGDDEQQFASRRAAYENGNCPGVDRFDNGTAWRIEIELTILCNALALSGADYEIVFVRQPNYVRMLAEAVSGRIDVAGQTIWSSELETYRDDLLRTEPVFRRGDWVVGLFTMANRADVLSVSRRADFDRLVGVAPQNWVEDWRVLNAIGLKQVVDGMNFQNINNMIESGRADVTLMSFSQEPDLGHGFDDQDHRLVPLQGLKVVLDASRHFAISRANENAAEIVAAIDKGLIRLRQDGSIKRMLSAAGFFDARVEDWELVNPEVLRNN
ncbi:MAG: hypothetical protein AAFY56_06300 [Pseudomonadota bacterium]